ncbi:MAG: hypothetical protein AB7O44_18265 [Hyphomicrobiaceae bacterium]
MFEPRKARLQAPVLRLQIVAAVLLSAIVLISMWTAAHRHAPNPLGEAHAAAPATADWGSGLVDPLVSTGRPASLPRG